MGMDWSVPGWRLVQVCGVVCDLAGIICPSRREGKGAFDTVEYRTVDRVVRQQGKATEEGGSVGHGLYRRPISGRKRGTSPGNVCLPSTFFLGNKHTYSCEFARTVCAQCWTQYIMVGACCQDGIFAIIFGKSGRTWDIREPRGKGRKRGGDYGWSARGFGARKTRKGAKVAKGLECGT
jgi:hypothetical protein